MSNYFNTLPLREKLKEFEAFEPGEELVENEFLDKGEKIFTM